MKISWEDEAFYVLEKNGFYSLITKKAFGYGDEVCIVLGEELIQPKRFSVQVAENIHVHVKAPVKFINHNCTGNIQLIERVFVATRAICEGEEITFNYNSSEDDLAEPFFCNNCGKLIRGRKYSKDYLKT